MDTLTIHAFSEDEARQVVADRLQIDPDLIECLGLAPEPEAEPQPQENPEIVPDSPPSEAAEAPGEPDTPIVDGMSAFLVRVQPEFWEQQAREWVQGMMKWFGVMSEVRVQTMGTQVFVRLSCAEPSILIGRQGHTLEALQHVVTRALTTQWSVFPEVVVDVESYKEKKLQRLERAARSAAHRALRFGKPQDLEPMTASERKYIHNALKDVEEVRTVSYGREPYRHVVVEPLDPTPRGGGGGPRSEGPRRRRPDHDRPERDRARPAFRRPFAAATEESHSDSSSSDETFDESLDWRPTFFKPPESAAPGGPEEPYPDVEDDLHN